MIATNHALTGVAIGLAVGQPLLAIPLAFVSHFALDSLPHFASKRLSKGSKQFLYYLVADAGACGAIVIWLAILQPTSWALAAVCAFVAASPDFMWAKEFLAAQKGKTIPKRVNWLAKFHSKIQWYQKEPGFLVELAWALSMLGALAKLITF